MSIDIKETVSGDYVYSYSVEKQKMSAPSEYMLGQQQGNLAADTHPNNNIRAEKQKINSNLENTKARYILLFQMC